ncbi:Endosomal targeting BRO1-like domain-containing protein [Hibiscus syriacus]|uniref:CASP-like protein n=1 Tax=Hibiscus syriacus TaxID=106335 RepID=A0A6A3ARF6_HIBSY|nr:CASP-like protein 1F3 isoform X2 [Hibiscus syriacus]KAE8707164.1 Endosomal targeting BRO1-like domain-containing protein [Hibiscus syriacus]
MAPEVAREKASDMVQAKGFAVSNTSKGGFFTVQTMVRVFAAVSTLAAICVMATSSQTIVLFGFTIKAHYSYSSAMRFLFVTNAIVSVSSVLSPIFLYRLRSSGSSPKSFFYLFLHDMVIMLLAISGCAASTAVGYVSRYGEEKMGWMAICNRVSKFCNHMTTAMVLSYLAFFSYFALAVMSSCKVMYRANDEYQSNERQAGS